MQTPRQLPDPHQVHPPDAEAEVQVRSAGVWRERRRLLSPTPRGAPAASGTRGAGKEGRETGDQREFIPESPPDPNSVETVALKAELSNTILYQYKLISFF